MIRFLVLFALPLAAQITVTLEPQPLSITERVVGSRQFGLWTATVQHADPGPHIVSRGTIIAATPVSELTLDMSRDIMARAARGNRWSLLGRAWDGGAPLVSQGLTAYGFAESAPGAQWAGAAIAGISLFRNLLRDTAPDPTPYVGRLLPDSITCNSGDCGTWYIVTGLVPGAARLVVEIRLDERQVAAERLEKIRRARVAVFGGAW